MRESLANLVSDVEELKLQVARLEELVYGRELHDYRPIPGHEQYLINRRGSVYSLKTGQLLRIQAIQHPYHTKSGEVRYRTKPYLAVMIDGKMMYIHRLVYMTYKGSIPPGYEIDHLDGDKTNNSLSNLQLVTHAENCRRYHEQRRKSICENL